MEFLLLAIVASVSVSVFLKVLKSVRIEVVVLCNYIVASFLTLILLKPNLKFDLNFSNSWLFLFLGFALPSGFIIMARAIRLAGIARADAAQRLSLFLPIIASFTIFSESLNFSVFIAILTAFLGLGCIVYKKSLEEFSLKPAIYLGLVWLVYGLCDIAFKLIAKSGNEFGKTLFLGFILAFFTLLAYLIIKKVKFELKSILAGLVLGCLNFANIYFYIKAHQNFSQNPSFVFTAMNIGVISAGLIIGYKFFKEPLSKINFIGIILGIISIILLLFFR